MKGKIKWFNMKKRFGYVTDENGQDYFVHVSEVSSGRNYTGFEPNDEVEFDAIVGNKGPMASNVKLVKLAPVVNNNVKRAPNNNNKNTENPPTSPVAEEGAPANN